MSTATCDYCGGYVEVSTLRHPGFCSPWRRDSDRLARQAERDRRKAKKAAKNAVQPW